MLAANKGWLWLHHVPVTTEVETCQLWSFVKKCIFVWPEKTFVECNTWHCLKDHYGWVDGRLVCYLARYYTKTSQEGKSGLFHPSHTPCWFASTLLIRMVLNGQPIRVSDGIQSSDSQPSQTLHVESDQTTSAWLQKLWTHLNTLDRKKYKK